jgi:hypothetical protein
MYRTLPIRKNKIGSERRVLWIQRRIMKGRFYTNLCCLIAPFEAYKIAIILQTPGIAVNHIPEEYASPARCPCGRRSPGIFNIKEASYRLEKSYHEKPMDCLCMFCSFLRLPAQASVTGMVVDGSDTMSSIVSVTGRLTRPVISMLWSPQIISGTGPWLRTKWSWLGVTKPPFSSAVRGGSMNKVLN